LLFADFGGPLNPEFFRAPRKEMGEIQGERYECLFRRAAFALLRVCFVALLLSSLGFPTNAAAPKRSVHARGHAFQELLAAREQAFQEFVAALWPLAEQRGVSRTTFDRAFAVDESVILGVWGLETDFGGFVGSNNVIQALATLAYVHFRGDYFRDELLSALVILQEGDIAPAVMRGSWAGAMGQMQFMPSSYLAYAVDFEGHGRRDIWMSDADAIGSTANYLAKHGWTAGLPWGFEVRLPSDFELTDTDSSSPAPFSAFAARGVERADGSAWPQSGEGRLMILAGLAGPVFLVTSNFDAIKAYNNSTAYALSVGLLGDAVTSGGSLAAQWPTRDRSPAAIEIRRLQAKLKKMGYAVGEVDGITGDALRSAVRGFQERNGLAPDGYADPTLLKRVAATRCAFSTDGLKPPLKERDRPVWRCPRAAVVP
jgi:membrane-bound lytic murein transglycosylase B